MIDKNIHQIWVGGYNIPEREVALYKEVAEKNSDYTHYLWTDDNLPEIPERLKDMYDEMYKQKDYVYCADMLRWIVVYQYGGWYLDIDWEYVKNLNEMDLSNKDGVVFGHWGVGWTGCDYTITNNVFAFAKEHPMVKHMIDTMPVDLGYQNAPYSPGWCGVECKRYMGLENEFSNEIWEYHGIMRHNLTSHNIEYGDYNTFQNEYLKHHALYSWSLENKKLWEQGLVK